MCKVPGEHLDAAIAALYPRMTFSHTTGGSKALGMRLQQADECDALLINQQDYKVLRNDPSYCYLRVIETLAPAAGGWSTQKRNWCVNAALSHALAAWSISGQLETLTSRYFQSVGCASGSHDSADSTSGRPLQADSEDVVAPFSPSSFFGLFVIWGAMTVAVLLSAYLPQTSCWKRSAEIIRKCLR